MSESFSYTTLLCRPSGFPHLPSAAENPEYINMKQVGMERHKFRNKINKIYIYKINTLHHFHFQILSLYSSICVLTHMDLIYSSEAFFQLNKPAAIVHML